MENILGELGYENLDESPKTVFVYQIGPIRKIGNLKEVLCLTYTEVSLALGAVVFSLPPQYPAASVSRVPAEVTRQGWPLASLGGQGARSCVLCPLCNVRYV